MYPVSIIADHKLTGKHPAVTSQLQDASLHVCASASMMSSMETRSDQCDDDQSVVASHSHEYADEQGLSYLNYFLVTFHGHAGFHLGGGGAGGAPSPLKAGSPPPPLGMATIYYVMYT